MAGRGRDDRPVAAGVVGGERRGQVGSKATAPETDSAVTSTEVPSRSARSRACRETASTRSASAASEEARASSQAVTRDGTALVPLGATSTRPNVARSSASRACLFAASAVIA